MARSVSKARPNPRVNLPKAKRPTVKGGSIPVDPDQPGPVTDHSNHTSTDLSPQTQAYALGMGGGGITPFGDGS